MAFCTVSISVCAQGPFGNVAGGMCRSFPPHTCWLCAAHTCSHVLPTALCGQQHPEDVSPSTTSGLLASTDFIKSRAGQSLGGASAAATAEWPCPSPVLDVNSLWETGSSQAECPPPSLQADSRIPMGDKGFLCWK